MKLSQQLPSIEAIQKLTDQTLRDSVIEDNKKAANKLLDQVKALSSTDSSVVIIEGRQLKLVNNQSSLSLVESSSGEGYQINKQGERKAVFKLTKNSEGLVVNKSIDIGTDDYTKAIEFLKSGVNQLKNSGNLTSSQRFRSEYLVNRA
jgi:hypothetical protein